jgi:secondary thiamine-phosphate synthase enzyme
MIRETDRSQEDIMLHEFTVRTSAQECLVEITSQIERIVGESGVTAGAALLYIPHTTCGITIQENADPGVQHDMLMLLRRIAPREDPGYRHIEDNSASHLQASAMGFAQFVFVEDGRLVLGRWQTIYLAEFDGPRTRRVLVKLLHD